MNYINIFFEAKIFLLLCSDEYLSYQPNPHTYRFFLIPGKQGQATQRLYSYITQEFSILEPYEETDNPVTVLWVDNKVGNCMILLIPPPSLWRGAEVGSKTLTSLQAQSDG